MFATTLPGLTQVLRDELEELDGVSVADSGFDGRSGVVLCEAEAGHRKQLLDLDVAEDVFVEVGRILRSHGDDPRWIARRIWRPERVGRALPGWAELAGGLRAKTTFRAIVRVLSERSFLRTDLRRELTAAIGQSQPRWQVADPARLEVWVVEYRPGRLVAGLRVSDVRMRQREGRVAERRGALRPVVAAAMVRQAGKPGGVLLDPCCGSGTVLAEAVRLGWSAHGADIDPDAVAAARRNVPAADVAVGDARQLKQLDDASVGACVSNLPFGKQFTVQGGMVGWQREVLGEMARVTWPGGRVVLLAPRVPRQVVPESLTQAGVFKVRVLGTWTRIWCYDRTSAQGRLYRPPGGRHDPSGSECA